MSLDKTFFAKNQFKFLKSTHTKINKNHDTANPRNQDLQA